MDLVFYVWQVLLICVRVKCDVLQPNLLTKKCLRNQLHKSAIVIMVPLIMAGVLLSLKLW